MAKKYKNKKGATGKKYTTYSDRIQVTYGDGSTRTVRPGDASYNVTKKAMESDIGAKKWYKSGNSKTTAETAIVNKNTGKNVKDGRGLVMSGTANKTAQKDMRKWRKDNGPSMKDAVVYGAESGANSALKGTQAFLQSTKSNLMESNYKKRATTQNFLAGLLEGEAKAKAQQQMVQERNGYLQRKAKLDAARRQTAAEQVAYQQALGQKYKPQSFDTGQKVVSDVTGGVVGMLPAIAASPVAGGVAGSAAGRALLPRILPAVTQRAAQNAAARATSYAILGMIAEGSGENQAINAGASLEDATKYGRMSAGKEIGTELLFGGIPALGKGVFDPAKHVTNRVAKVGLEMLGEGVEESAAEAIDPFLQRATYDPNAQNASLQDILYAGAIGGLTSGALKGGAHLTGKAMGAVPNMGTVSEAISQTLRQAQQEKADTALFGQNLQQRIQQQEEIRRQNAQTAQNTPQQVQNQQTTDTTTIVPNVAQVQNNKADNFTPQEMAVNRLEMTERTFENVGNRKVKAYQQENPAVKPFYQETAANLLADLQMGIKGGRDVGINPETRNVTTRGGWQRQQSEPINRMLDDGMTYAEIEDGLRRLVEDSGVENTANAKRVELYVHDAVTKGYRSIQGDVSGSNEFAYRGMNMEQLQTELNRLENSFLPENTDEQNQAIIQQMEAVENQMQALAAQQEPLQQNDIMPKLERPKQQDNIANYADYDLSKLRPEVKAFLEQVGDKSGFDVVIFDGLPKGANGMYQNGVVYLDGNKVNSLETARKIAAHEVYHGLRGTEEFMDLQDIALEYLLAGNKNMNRQQLIQSKMEQYSKLGVEIDTETAYDELTAEFMEQALSDPKVAERIWQERPSLAQRIVDFIQSLMQRFTGHAMSAPEQQQRVLLQRAADMYAKGLQSMQYQQPNQSGEMRYMFVGKNADGIEAYETSEGIKKLPYSERKKEFLRLMQEEYAGRTARFTVNGENYYARFDKKDVSKNIYGDKRSSEKGWKAKINAGADGDIFDLVENSDYQKSALEQGKDTSAHKGVQGWDYFAKTVQIDDHVFDLLVNVRKKQNGEFVYSLELHENKTKKASLPLAITKENGVKVGAQRSKNIIPQNQRNGNSNIRYSLSKPAKLPAPEVQQQNLQNFMADSKVKNADGSPKVMYSGHGNTNLFGSSFDPKKATAGGFYFTDNTAIASSYAKDKLGEKEEYTDGTAYRFKDSKGNYKLTIDKVMLTPEQQQVIDDYLEEDMGYTFDEYVKENARYDRNIAALRYGGGSANLQNVYKLLDTLGFTADGFDYKTGQPGNSTFEELMNDMGLEWDSYEKASPGVFPVYLNITDPLETSEHFPDGLMYALELAAQKEKRYSEDEIDRRKWTSNYPLRNWVEDIKQMEETGEETFWATHIPKKAKKIMQEFGYDGIHDTGGKMGGEGHEVWIAFEPGQVKSAIGNRGTYDASKKDIRYSLNDKVGQYGAIPAGENPMGNNRDIQVPKRTSDFDKVRKGTRTGMEAEQVADETVAGIQKELDSDVQSGMFTYEPTSNKADLAEANKRIAANGWEETGRQLHEAVLSGRRINSADMATLERLIQEAQKAGQYDKAVDFVSDLAVIGTESGQNIQAIRMLKRLTPEGQLITLKNAQRRINNSLISKGQPAVPEISGEVAQEFLQARGNKMRGEIWDREIARMAQQTEGSWVDKLNAIRYAAMLSNPRTHIRNLLGNCAMQIARVPTNIISAVLEDTVSISQKRLKPNGIEQNRSLRNKTGQSSKELRKYAEMAWTADGEAAMRNVGNRYDDVSGQFAQNQRVFGHTKAGNVMEALAGNGKHSVGSVLDAEDMWFKHATYVNTLVAYMKANGITTRDATLNVVKPNGASIGKGMEYAGLQARKATFTEDNKLANHISKLENTNLGTQLALGAILPFKKTPMNIITRGIEYSPVGVLMTGYKLQDAARHQKTVKEYDELENRYSKKKVARESRYTVNDVLESLAANATGTILLKVGMELAAAGMLAATGDDEDKRKEQYDQQMGDQNFAVVLDDGSTYTIDWLAPAAMPLLTGVEVYNQLFSGKYDETDDTLVSRALSAAGKIADPVFEMSCMQGVASALASYSGDAGDIASTLAANIGTGYAGQFIPAPVGALARTIDDTVRSSYASKESPYTKTGENFLRQQRSKLPGLSKQNEASIDVWGNERKREFAGSDPSDITMRVISNFIGPGNYSSNKRTALDDKLTKLYEATGDSGVLPKRADTYIKRDGEPTVYLSPHEYSRFSTTKGKKSAQYAGDFTSSDAYKNLDDTTKADIVSKLYGLANYEAKKEALKGRGVDYADKAYENVLQSGVKPYEYYATKERFSGKWSNYDVVKEYAEHADKMGMKDSQYVAVYDLLGDLEADKDRNGKSISGSRKEKVLTYLNGERDKGNITKEQWWYFYTMEYPSQAKNAPYAWIREANK